MSCVELIFFFFVLHTGSYSSFNLKEMVMPGQFYLFFNYSIKLNCQSFCCKTVFLSLYMMVPEWLNDEDGEMQGNNKIYVFKYKHLNYL